MNEQVSQSLINEFVYPNGERGWFDVQIRPVDAGILILTIDISELMRSNEQTKKQNRIYAVLSDINQAIVRLRDLQELFDKACQIAVEKGHFLQACMGWIDPSSRQFRWRASAGVCGGFPAGMELNLNTDSLKRPALLKMLLSGQIWIDNQFNQHANPDAWIKEALALNFQSGIAFPLVVLGEIRGVFCLYAGEANFFNDDELALLSEMAMDLAFAVEFSERENQRMLAVKSVRANEKLYRSLFDNMAEGLAYCRMEYLDGLAQDFVYLEVNKNFSRLTGLNDVVGKKVSEVIPGIQQDNPELIETYGRVAQTGVPERFESYLPALKMWFSVSVYSPEPGYFVSVFEIITERRNAEAALRKSEQTYRLLAENTRDVIWVMDAETLRFTYVSPSVTALRGYTPEEIMAVPMDDALMPEARKHMHELIRRVSADLRAGKPNPEIGAINEVEQPCKDGSTVWTEVTTRYYLNPENGKVEIVGITRDVTLRRNTQAALRESEARFRSAFEYNLAGMSLANPDIRLIQVNPAFCRILRYAEDELIGHSILEFTYPDDIAVSRDAHKELLDGRQKSLRIEKRYIRKDGQVIWADVSMAVVMDPEGHALYMISHLIEITERKQAEQEIRDLNVELERRVEERTAELSDLFNNAPCGYHSLDEKGTIININDTELKWLGYSREEITGKQQIMDLFTPGSREVFAEQFPAFKERGWLKDLELDMLRRDGSTLPVLVTATAIRNEDGRFLLSRSTLVDNTDRKQAEKVRQEAQARLETAKNELEAANRELEAFSYSVSHDLRAPLRAINGFARIIEEDYAASLDADGVRLFENILRNTQQMDRLITDLLALSRVSTGEINAEMIDMAGLVQSSYDETASAEAKEKFTLLLAPLPQAWGDPILIRQVWVNLISNAIKYSLRAENPRIEIGSREENGAVTYFVRDNGVGFDPIYAPKLFGVFQRLHKSSDFEGVGLGLAIVQRIIRRHGGSVKAEGMPGKGAVFSFSLPAKKEAD